MATATKKNVTRGFKVHCPFCGEENSLRFNVDDVHQMTCGNCDGEVTPDDIREVMAQWSKLLAWLDTARLLADLHHNLRRLVLFLVRYVVVSSDS